MPSWDGSKLDVDLTLPARDTGGSHPLMIFLHGFGNNKREWESLTDAADGADKHDWNSHWFARHGFYRIDTLAEGDADRASGTLRLPLYGNHWPLAPGHRLRVDLQEVDMPYLRRTNVANVVRFDPPRLVLPTREAGDLALAGT